MSTVKEAVDVLFEKLTPEIVRGFMRHLKCQARMKSLETIGEFVKQFDPDNDADGLIASISAAIMGNLADGFYEIWKHTGKEDVTGHQMAEMAIGVLRKMADKIESEKPKDEGNTDDKPKV